MSYRRSNKLSLTHSIYKLAMKSRRLETKITIVIVCFDVLILEKFTPFLFLQRARRCRKWWIKSLVKTQDIFTTSATPQMVVKKKKKQKDRIPQKDQGTNVCINHKCILLNTCILGYNSVTCFISQVILQYSLYIMFLSEQYFLGSFKI